MGTRKFTSPEFPLAVEIQDGAYNSMLADCQKSPKLETGSILVGRYSQNGTIAKIQEAFSPPLDSVGTKSTFFRGTSGLSKELDLRWANTGTYYVGEWHYHPLGNGHPSERDINQMVQFARDPEMQCLVPVLVIMAPSTQHGYGLGVFIFTKEGRSYSLDLVTETQAES